jgi:hypothetical protein
MVPQPEDMSTMLRPLSVVFASVLVALGVLASLVAAVPPAAAATTVVQVTRCDYTTIGSPSGETVAHWDEALLKETYGAGITVTQVEFSWILSGFTLSSSGRIEGENARAETPYKASSGTARVRLSNGTLLSSSASCHLI